MATRRLMVLCSTLALVASVGTFRPVAAGAAPPVAAPAFQNITGGGSGAWYAHGPDGIVITGSYTSTSQLGHGRFSIWYSVPHATPPARFTRSDGMTLTGRTELGADCPGNPEHACVDVALYGSGDIALVGLQVAVDLNNTTMQAGIIFTGYMQVSQPLGYAMVSTNGTAYTFGGVKYLGDASTGSAVGIALTPSRRGYWIVDSAGQVFTFGGASNFGVPGPSTFAAGETVTSISPTPTGKGYWLFTSKGRVVPFGDAHPFGDLHDTPLNGRIVGSIATPTGNGYYMVGSDGGVFAFGDAKFRGSMGSARLNEPVVGLVPTADNTGYWLVASDGGVFSFDAPFHGSMGAVALTRPVVTMVPYGGAYLMIAADGGIFNFSNGLFFGSLGGANIPHPIVAGASAG